MQIHEYDHGLILDTYLGDTCGRVHKFTVEAFFNFLESAPVEVAHSIFFCCIPLFIFLNCDFLRPFYIFNRLFSIRLLLKVTKKLPSKEFQKI